MGSHDCTWNMDQQSYPLCWGLWIFTTPFFPDKSLWGNTATPSPYLAPDPCLQLWGQMAGRCSLCSVESNR